MFFQDERFDKKIFTCSIVKEIQGAPEEKPVSERTPLSRKYILEDYKMCGHLYRLLYTLAKKNLRLLDCGAQKGMARN